MFLFQNKEFINPAIFKKSQINVTKFLRGFSAGAYSSLFQNQGLEYAESKPFTYGDNIRYIDWKLSGRMNTLYTKYFHEERNRTVWLIFDCSGSMNIGAPMSVYDIALETAMTLLLLSFSQKDKIGTVIFDDKIRFFTPPTTVSSSLQRIYSKLEEHRFSHNKGNLETAIQFSKKILLHRSLVIVVSDFIMQNYFEFLSNLSVVHDLLVVRVFYNLRDNFPNAISFRATDTETNESRLISSDYIKKQYIENQQQMHRLWRNLSFKKNTSLIEISTTDSVFNKIAEFIQRKRRV